MNARRVDVTEIGTDSYLVTVGDARVAVNYVELRALAVEIAEAVER
ncbi:hypothetical protein [Mycolicibacter arupensis]|nr:hypothetical protein [Mycolicibacter arupensis]